MDAPTAPTPHPPTTARSIRRRWGRSRPVYRPVAAALPEVRTPDVVVVVVEHGRLTPTTLPTAAVLATSPVPRVRVALDGETLNGDMQGLRRRLAPDWTVSDDTDPLLDLAVVRGTDPGRVVRLCREHPGLAVLALIPADAAPELAVSMLSAGADGCLRGADPDEVNAHLRAMSRRVGRRNELLPV
jgi:hypothetical protein